MLLLTGATGRVGAPLLRRLTTARVPVRCLVRDPRGLGPERVRVQIALGDLGDPPSFRNALRGVSTVVHLAAAIRDQDAGSIEELNGIATWRLVQAAERAGVEHFVFTSALGASAHHRARFMRAKALAEQAVAASSVRHTILASSLVYAPGDPLLTLLGRLALLPVVPIGGRGTASFEPIWADDVADCLLAALERPVDPASPSVRLELAGPERLTYAQFTRAVLAAAGRPRPLLPLPLGVAARGLKVAEALMKSAAPATWDEAELLTTSMVSPDGTAGAERLGVVPKRLAAVLGTAV